MAPGTGRKVKLYKGGGNSKKGQERHKWEKLCQGRVRR